MSHKSLFPSLLYVNKICSPSGENEGKNALKSVSVRNFFSLVFKLTTVICSIPFSRDVNAMYSSLRENDGGPFSLADSERI